MLKHFPLNSSQYILVFLKIIHDVLVLGVKDTIVSNNIHCYANVANKTEHLAGTRKHLNTHTHTFRVLYIQILEYIITIGTRTMLSAVQGCALGPLVNASVVPGQGQ